MNLAQMLARALTAREKKPPPPTVLRSEPVEVKVVAEKPPLDYPWPSNLIEIMLGGRTRRPTGTWTPNRIIERGAPYMDMAPAPDPSFFDKIDRAWNFLRDEFPHVAQFVRRMDADWTMPEPEAAATYMNDDFPTTIFINPASVSNPRFGSPGAGDILTHELGHVAQRLAFPDLPDYTRAFNPPREDYFFRIGEQQSRELERQLSRWLVRRMVDQKGRKRGR